MSSGLSLPGRKSKPPPSSTNAPLPFLKRTRFPGVPLSTGAGPDEGDEDDDDAAAGVGYGDGRPPRFAIAPRMDTAERAAAAGFKNVDSSMSRAAFDFVPGSWERFQQV